MFQCASMAQGRVCREGTDGATDEPFVALTLCVFHWDLQSYACIRGVVRRSRAAGTFFPSASSSEHCVRCDPSSRT